MRLTSHRQQPDQQARGEHHQQPQPYGALGTGADQRRLLGALLAQFGHQFAHLIAGGAIDTFDRHITGRRVTTGSDEGVTAFLVRGAELTMLVTQSLDAGFQRRLEALLIRQLAENPLHIALAIFKLAPVFAQVSRLLAAQQDVFPLLYLDLELQVGFVDQLRGVQRTADQLAVVLHAVGQEVKAGQRDQQHRQQAAAQQGQNLRSQGFLQRHRRYSRQG